MNIIKNRYLYFLISLLIIIPGYHLHGHQLGKPRNSISARY